MAAIPASVIVVSRHRPQALRLCLMALMQQDHPGFELIVVADPEAALQAAAQLGAGPGRRVLPFDAANISAARNLGLCHAAGEVVAFIDDDAVAEPSWLSRLTAAFARPEVVAATGFVRGRNGLSLQWQAGEVDNRGQDHPLAVTGPVSLAGTPRRAVKTQGTNCAFRRAVLMTIGGFDPALRFYLDEADVNLRLAGLGLTAIRPDAEVLHGYAASARRRADRVPLSLHEIAASTAVFLRRHAPGEDLAPARAGLETREEARIAGHLAAGRLDAAAADALRRSLAAGWGDGLSRALPDLAALTPAGVGGFAALPGTGPRPGIVLAGRFWSLPRLKARARRLVAAGCIVTVICLSPTARPHRLRFHPDGFWLQTGGMFGQSLREGPRLRLTGFRRRVAIESARIALTRPIA